MQGQNYYQPGGGIYLMGPGDYESGLTIPTAEPPGAPTPGDVLGSEVFADVPPGTLDTAPGLELATFDPLPDAPTLAPGTFVNIAIGIAIGIVFDRLFLR